MKHIVTSDNTYPIQLKDIDTSVHFWDAFGKTEKEISARWIVRYCQSQGAWVPFTGNEIDGFYRSCGYHDGFRFNGLTDDKHLMEDNGWLHVTHDFVAKCFLDAPKLEDTANA
jgi:hypothetical protein